MEEKSFEEKLREIISYSEDIIKMFNTQAWEKFITPIKEQVSLLEKKLRKCSIEEFPRLQGELLGLDVILNTYELFKSSYENAKKEIKKIQNEEE